MRKIQITVFIALLIFLAGCGNQSPRTNPTQAPTQSAIRPETTQADTQIQPGQTKAAFSSSTEQTKPAGKATSPSQKKSLEVVDSHIEKDGLISYIAGTVKNNSNQAYGYVQVEFNLYNDPGTQVGIAFANTNYLLSGDTWEFRALMPEVNAKKYKVKDIIGL